MRSNYVFLTGLSLALAMAAVAFCAVHDDWLDFPYLSYDHAAIHYSATAPNDAITRLQAKLDRGEVQLAFDERFGYLPNLLKLLEIRTDSQMLVFSKTSFQGPRISPQAPRALYFNDDVAVGFVPNGTMMEFVAEDPRLGTVFYTMDRAKADKPRFVRRVDECLSCHLNPGTVAVPGTIITSVIPAPDGSLRPGAESVIVDSRTPLDQRWGGWYVTGTAGSLVHRGNSVSAHPREPDSLDLRGNQNITSLSGRLDTTRYLAPTSDLIALMTIEHQTRVTNLLTRLGWEARIAMQEEKLAESYERLKYVAAELVAYMLFADEAPIHDPIAGVSTFTETFPQRGPRDRKGRSLRDFDLKTRLFRYPLSYMIYDTAFDQLPDAARELVYRKLFDVLSGKDSSSRYARLSAQDRRTILEILRDTKPDLPGYYRSTVADAKPR